MTTLDSVDDTSNKVSEKMDSNDNQQEQQQNGQTENGEKDADNQDNANEEDYIGLDVVDTWDDDEKDRPRRRSWDRTRGRDKRNSREQERDRDRERERERDRDRDRGRRRSRSYDRRRSRSCDRKRDSNRRDPNKSSKDIEQDKMRTKKDNDSKMLAEKEKAIKNLLDSDEVVPPGTETEAIENMVDKTKQDEDKGKEEEKARRDSQENRKSRDERRRSPIHNRLGRRIISPRRSPRRSPIRYSPDRRRKKTPINYSPEDRRRRSYDRQTSVERREASRRRLRERLAREGRRSRSRDRRSLERHRSRSFDRHRRLSRSPFDRRRRRSLSRSPVRSPSRRKRSPFLNEIARQFQGDTLPPLQPPIGPIHGMGPVGPMYMPPGIVPGPGGILPPPQGPIMPGPPNIGPGHAELDHPWQQWSLHNYEGCPPGINFDPLNRAPTDYPNPGMYNAPIPHHMRPPSPQPVPAPGQAPPAPMIFSSVPLGPVQPPLQVPGPKYSPNEAFGIISKSDMIANHRSRGKREGRMKTPEPPIISDIKQHEKTSLSSLLEASVSTKDSSSLTASFKGFRPEIIRNCERALRSLPAEDPRLKMKGRFFFDPMKKDNEKDKKEIASNSILLRKGRTEIHWDEEENQISTTQQPPVRKRVVTHQKICQTDETTKESIGLQAEPERADFWMQVSPLDLMPKEERRPPLDDMRRIPMDERRNPIDDRRGPMDDRRGPIDDRRGLVDDRRGLMDERARLMDENRRPLTDRLDWSMRETYDHSSKLRDNMDLRWSLSSSQNSRPQQNSNLWTRSFSPNRQQMPNDILHRSGMPMSNMDNIPRVGMDRMMDSRDRLMDSRDRLMDPRDREIDIRDREVDMRDVRALDSMRDRDRLIDTREGMMMGGGAGVGPTGFRDSMINDTFSRQPKNVDDYELRKNPFSRGNLDREIPSRDPDHESPVPLEEDNEELEIIEERGFDRDQQWQRNNTTSLAALNNARGAAAIRGGGALPAANRSFRGRAVGFRAKY